MFIYHHTCLDCGAFPVETKSIGEYVALGFKYGRTESDDVQVPCPSCDKLAPRDYNAGKMPYVKVQAGKLYKTRGYQDGAIKDWYREEIKHTKNVIDHATGKPTKSPYTGMTTNNPESMGFKKVTESEAKARADVARKMASKIDDSRKNS